MNNSTQADIAAKRCSQAHELLRLNKPMEALTVLEQALEADRDCALAIIGIIMIRKAHSRSVVCDG
jgi:lipopolysaccharide biosynthesis regulator YciM